MNVISKQRVESKPIKEMTEYKLLCILCIFLMTPNTIHEMVNLGCLLTQTAELNIKRINGNAVHQTKSSLTKTCEIQDE